MAAKKLSPQFDQDGSQQEFSAYQRKSLDLLSFVAVNRYRVLRKENKNSFYYALDSIPVIGSCLYWIITFNTGVKAVFLAFLITDYFGPVEFADKIGALDYILCTGLIVLAWTIFFEKYPLYEILQSSWKVMNEMYVEMNCNKEVLQEVKGTQKLIAAVNIGISVFGGTSLMMQYFADPKYCIFTYSSFELDILPLRLLFALHEFLFMTLAWDAYLAAVAITMYQSVAMSRIVDQMTEKLNALKPNQHNLCQDFDHLLKNYRMLTILTNHLNDTIAYKTLFTHLVAGCQFVSDVYASTHIIKLPGAVFIDIFFYIEDGTTAAFVILRIYEYMSCLAPAADRFLRGIRMFQLRMRGNPELGKRSKKKARSLQPISLKVGPCRIAPEAMLTVLDQMTTYSLAAALW
ncbi:unnamed protein product [Orchesella dallaii]|uniref:Odorant receptor n=1 Tax=Orchesella dallaii TaxID=48710 RepID=A0ABP1R4M2_9HEXA